MLQTSQRSLQVLRWSDWLAAVGAVMIVLPLMGQLLMLTVPADVEIRGNSALEVLLILSMFPAFAWLPIVFAVPIYAILLSFGWGG
ncbi:hypothetical protein [Roseovarius dicentrarchi]|uniref:hypothetical protein n=1 Tax=Roseovarius dicentrarchi TaxID=2250573 RepID=UPI000DE92DB9|nr:hypothetical protein [Roseovarius dicentrarchi]